MIAVQDTLISDDIRDVKFACDLCACKGACCIDGDAGAPLDEEEIGIVEDCLDDVLPYMTPEGIKVVKEYGVFDYDSFGNYVTPLVNNSACAFVYFDNGVAGCVFEKAYFEKKINFRKPVSCHLYPIRISKYSDFEAVNYHEWHICKPALLSGKTNDMPLYKFLKDSLIRKYGNKWYSELVEKIEK